MQCIPQYDAENSVASVKYVNGLWFDPGAALATESLVIRVMGVFPANFLPVLQFSTSGQVRGRQTDGQTDDDRQRLMPPPFWMSDAAVALNIPFFHASKFIMPHP